MAKRINNVSELREYLEGVLARIEHHAASFAPVASYIFAGALSCAESLECRTHKGKMGNVLRFSTTNGRSYALRFRHGPDRIDLVEGHESSKQVVASFDDTSTMAEVLGTFRRLRVKLLRLRLLSRRPQVEAGSTLITGAVGQSLPLSPLEGARRWPAERG